MRTLINIVSISPNKVPATTMKALINAFPDGARYRDEPQGKVLAAFRCALFSSNPVMRRILAILKTDGFEPWLDDSRERRPNEYWVRWKHDYDPEELAAADLLRPHPRIYSEGLHRNKKGLIQLQYEKLKKRAGVAFTGSGLIVANRIKTILQDEMSHAIFRPTVVMKGPLLVERTLVPWKEIGPPFWELISDLILPPLSPSMTLLDKNGHPCNGNFSNGCYMKEGLYENPEPHYTRKAIKKAGKFDVALTHERFGINPAEEDRQLIVSPRFYKICTEAKLEMDWTIVRIDP